MLSLSQVRRVLQSFLEVREQLNSRRKSGGTLMSINATTSSSSTSREDNLLLNKLRKVFFDLMHLVPVTDKKSSLFEKLNGIK